MERLPVPPGVVPCSIYADHYPMYARTVDHHIQPLGMGGADVAANKVHCCDLCHFCIHRALGQLLTADHITGKPADPSVMTLGMPRHQRLALRGYQAWLDAGRPGRPVWELAATHGSYDLAA